MKDGSCCGPELLLNLSFVHRFMMFVAVYGHSDCTMQEHTIKKYCHLALRKEHLRISHLTGIRQLQPNDRIKTVLV